MAQYVMPCQEHLWILLSSEADRQQKHGRVDPSLDWNTRSVQNKLTKHQ